MLLTYIDEIGSRTEYVSKDHPKYNTSPAFGYAGFIIPDDKAREFGAYFVSIRNRLYREEYNKSDIPGRFEVKGSDVFRVNKYKLYPQNIKYFMKLVNKLNYLGGKIFYFVKEKPRGTFPEINKSLDYRYSKRDEGGLRQWMDDMHDFIMRQVLNRLARHAVASDENIMVMMDQINENERKPYMSLAYAHILSRSSKYPEMDKIVEPPMHIDSSISANIQFADWVSAFLSKFIFYQLDDGWEHYVPENDMKLLFVNKIFTYESKMEFYGYTVDIHNSEVLHECRPKFSASSIGGSNISQGSWEALQKVARASNLL